MKHLKFIISALFLFFTMSRHFAQTTESLLIGPGDMLHVQVFDTPELEQHARVTDDGNVPLIFLGNVHVAGLDARSALRASLRAT